MTYQFIPHTADIRMKVSGKNSEEIFISSLEGMNKVLMPKISQEKIRTSVIKVSGDNPTILLINFLNEILTLENIDKVCFQNVKFLKLTNNELIAKISGSPIENFEREIKAVSFHEADIKKNKSNFWETMIVFDI